MHQNSTICTDILKMTYSDTQNMRTGFDRPNIMHSGSWTNQHYAQAILKYLTGKTCAQGGHACVWFKMDLEFNKAKTLLSKKEGFNSDGIKAEIYFNQV